MQARDGDEVKSRSIAVLCVLVLIMMIAANVAAVQPVAIITLAPSPTPSLQGTQREIRDVLSAWERTKYALNYASQAIDNFVMATEVLTLTTPVRFGPVTGGDYPVVAAPVAEIIAKYQSGALVLVKVGGAGSPAPAGWYRVLDVAPTYLLIAPLDSMTAPGTTLTNPARWVVAARYFEAWGP